jgi:hypothetical protein
MRGDSVSLRSRSLSTCMRSPHVAFRYDTLRTNRSSSAAAHKMFSSLFFYQLLVDGFVICDDLSRFSFSLMITWLRYLYCTCCECTNSSIWNATCIHLKAVKPPTIQFSLINNLGGGLGKECRTEFSMHYLEPNLLSLVLLTILYYSFTLVKAKHLYVLILSHSMLVTPVTKSGT